MTTLPRIPSYLPTAIDHRIASELARAISERDAAKQRGDWVTKQACDMAIDVLMRLQKGATK